jgi:flagellar biosynthesis/type III secretory pathway protein FliH
MTPYRLRTLSPAEDTARARAHEIDRRIAEARAEAQAAGFLEGRAAATEAFLADQARLTSELIEALSDARLTNEAARRHVAASLAPVIEHLCAAITPALAETGLFAEITRLVARAIETAPAALPRLRCAPEVAPAIAKALNARGLDAEVRGAPELGPREARIAWDQGYDHLDLDACVEKIHAILAAQLCAEETEAEPAEQRRHA